MPPFRGTYILVAIDGTSSSDIVETSGTTHTHMFYQDFPTLNNFKKYIHGPGAMHLYKHGGILGVAGGASCNSKIQQTISFVEDAVSKLYKLKYSREKNWQEWYNHHSNKTFPFIELSPRDRKNLRVFFKDKIRICLVGHSRGGMIAIEAARHMPLPVYFMGLYDAVNMSPNHTDNNKIHNVDYTYHAMRDRTLIRSRQNRHPWTKYIPSVQTQAYHLFTEWGNCGTESSGNLYKKTFYTSHGGINGTAEFWSSGFTSEDVCFNNTQRAKKHKEYYYIDTSALCEDEGLAADQFIRSGAKKVGISMP